MPHLPYLTISSIAFPDCYSLLSVRGNGVAYLLHFREMGGFDECLLDEITAGMRPDSFQIDLLFLLW